MEFCNFVPAAARSYTLEMINGEPPKWDGLQRLVDKAKEQLDQLLKKNQARVEQGNLLSAAAVREQRRAEAHYKQLMGDLDAVQRFGTDLQMEPAYKALKTSSDKDEPLRRFLHAARGARIDFLRYKDALDRATILSEIRFLVLLQSLDLIESDRSKDLPERVRNTRYSAPNPLTLQFEHPICSKTVDHGELVKTQ